MFWALGAILLQLHAVPQVMVPSAGRPAAPQAITETVSASRLREERASAAIGTPEKLLLADASVSDETGPLEPGRILLTPAAGAPSAALPAASPAPIAPVISARRPARYAGRISDGPKKQWLAMAVAAHSAAAFDAWTTRRAITRNGAQELNPMLKPFAGNSSIYAATQVAPALLDLLGRRMMTSRHPILRHTWWLPQALSTAASLAGGMHNLGGR